MNADAYELSPSTKEKLEFLLPLANGDQDLTVAGYTALLMKKYKQAVDSNLLRAVRKTVSETQGQATLGNVLMRYPKAFQARSGTSRKKASAANDEAPKNTTRRKTAHRHIGFPGLSNQERKVIAQVREGLNDPGVVRVLIEKSGGDLRVKLGKIQFVEA